MHCYADSNFEAAFDTIVRDYFQEEAKDAMLCMRVDVVNEPSTGTVLLHRGRKNKRLNNIMSECGEACRQDITEWQKRACRIMRSGR